MSLEGFRARARVSRRDEPSRSTTPNRRGLETWPKLATDDDSVAGAFRYLPGVPTPRFRLEKVMKTGIELMLAGLVATFGCKGPGEAAPSAATSAAPAAASAAAAPAATPKASETGPIKVGILHSLSGTMAISETSLKDVALMTIEQINAPGGVKGRM